MTREIDVRRPADRGDAERRDALHEGAEAASAALPGDHRVTVASFDQETGNAAVVVSNDADAVRGDYVRRALWHVQRIGPALGLAPDEPPEYVADPEPQETSSGAVAVHLRQQYKGIPIYDGTETVRFDPDGTLRETAGRAWTVDGDLQVTPAVTAEEALRTAAEHLATPLTGEEAGVDPFGQPLDEPGIDLSGFDPAVRTFGQDRPDQTTTFDAPPFPHAVTVALMWFPLDGGLRLAWHLRLQTPGEGPVYRLLVDTADRRILLCKRLTHTIVGRAEVVLTPGQPAQSVTMPMTLASHGAPVPGGLPDGFPDPWLTGSSTSGASVQAVLAEGTSAVAGTVQGDQVVFPATGDPDRLVVNLFALCSVMHDVLYLLGFREADGNFQVDNHGRGGRAADPVLARVHPEPVWGTANMSTPADGRQPTMNMGLVASTQRHTALDGSVVYHEFAHGLTNRLVGGPLDSRSLDAEQSGGMGEGWSDFVACTMLGTIVVGDWVVNRAGGIRKFRYDAAFPDDFGDLGTGRYVGDAVHPIGEIWCATLMELSRRLGVWETAQIVVDALKLTAANPSFLAARDAILLAAGHFASHQGADPAARDRFMHTVWEGFARFGMGPGARTNGATLTGIVADFEAPPRPSSAAVVRAEARPELTIPDNHPAGVTSEVTLPDAGPVRELAVTVDITHSYRGDLEVSLQPPTGSPVMLHRREGGRADDLRQTWRSAEHAGLAGLRDLPAGGQWRLQVVDRAPVDIGVLHSWAVEAEVGEARRQLVAEAPAGLAIPGKKAAGVRSDVVVEEQGTISTLRLEVDITHSYVGDLEVTLHGPDKRKVKVHRREKDGGDSLVVAYASADDGPLASFLGQPVTGIWTLQVADRAGRDVGKLNRWRLRAEL